MQRYPPSFASVEMEVSLSYYCSKFFLLSEDFLVHVSYKYSSYMRYLC